MKSFLRIQSVLYVHEKVEMNSYCFMGILALFLCYGLSLLASEPMARKRKVVPEQGSSIEKKAKVSEPRKRVVEYAPVFPVLKIAHDQKLGMLDIQVIASYLMEKTTVTDVGKLPRLLSMAQGYSLAVYDAPLFIQGVIEQFVDRDCDEGVLSEVQQRHLDAVCLLWADEVDAEHLFIEYSLITDYFREPARWIKYMIKRLTLAKTDKEFSSLVCGMREYISYSCMSAEDCNVLQECCIKSKGDLEAVLVSCTFVDSVSWPHQATQFEAFMGHLFFPVQLEYLYETVDRLKLRGPLQDLLALSASYGNLLAQCHLADIFVWYDERSDKEIQDHVVRYYGDAGKKLIDSYVNKSSKKKKLPYYFCGLLCIEKNKPQMARSYFKKGHEKGDGWCTYRYALGLKDVQKKRKLVEVLRDRELGLAHLLKARLVKDTDERIRLLCEAGEAGCGEGYMTAGILAKTTQSDAAYEYYLLAGEQHILSAYSEVALLLKNEGNLEEMKEVYCMQAAWGEEEGLMNLADHLMKEKREEEAEIVYEKGGLRCYDQFLATTKNRKRKKEFTEKRTLLKKARFDLLQGKVSSDTE